MSVSAKPKQKAGRPVVLEVGCDEDCTAAAGGVVVVNARRRFELSTGGAEIGAGGSVALQVRPTGRKARRALGRLVLNGARASATITILFADRSGNSTTGKRVVRLTS